MNPQSDFEIVEVVSECRLLGADAREHVYWRRDGRPLALGHYVVTWPVTPRRGRYDEEAQFKGPYGGRPEAQAALDRLRRRLDVPRLPQGHPWTPVEADRRPAGQSLA